MIICERSLRLGRNAAVLFDKCRVYSAVDWDNQPSNDSKMHRFIDQLCIRVNAGNGGNGASSFERTSIQPRGVPSGGDGGNGGSVVVKCDAKLSSLSHLIKQRVVQAPHGLAGRHQNMSGQNAASLELMVPPGTMIKAWRIDPSILESNLNWKYCVDEIRSNSSIVVDQTLLTDKQSLLVARGGEGGRGNASLGVNNEERELGKTGEMVLLDLELGIIGDVGLVGLPNAGKSSILAAISRARPKIASYPFTTLKPHIGILKSKADQDLSVIDIPGLIDGAHLNRGLGHAFLRHIARSRMLALVVDFSSDSLESDIHVLLHELEEYDTNLVDRVKMVIGNKCDLLTNGLEVQMRIDQCRKALNATLKDIPVVPVSAKHYLALDHLKDHMFSICKI